MGDIIEYKKHHLHKIDTSPDAKNSDLAMFAILFFQKHFTEELKDIDLEVKYALVISVYRFMVEAEKNGDVEITKDGFEVNNEASLELQERIRNAVDEKSY